MRVLFFILIVFVFSATAQTPFEKAMQTAKDGNFENALENYRQALSRPEDEKPGDVFRAKVHFNIGVCLYRLQRNAEAVEELTKAIEISGGAYQRAFYALGMAQSELKHWRKAETAFRAALKIKPNDGETWFDLAMIYLEEKYFDLAAEAFQNSIKFKSVAAADAHNNLGVIAALKNDWDSAEKEFRTALINSDGKSIEARRNLQFCKSFKQHSAKDLTAELIFSAVSKKGE